MENLDKTDSKQCNHLNERWLRTKYLVEGLSTYQIAAIVDRNPKRIYEKLRDFGIKTRSRAETLKNNSWWALGKYPRHGWKHSQKTKNILRNKALGRIGLIGDKNPMFGRNGSLSARWKGGTTPERQSLYSKQEWKNIIKFIYARDDYKCKRCGTGHTKNNKLHAHHVKSWAEHKDLRSDPDNLITVCDECHYWIHSKNNIKKEFIA